MSSLHVSKASSVTERADSSISAGNRSRKPLPVDLKDGVMLDRHLKCVRDRRVTLNRARLQDASTRIVPIKNLPLGGEGAEALGEALSPELLAWWLCVKEDGLMMENV